MNDSSNSEDHELNKIRMKKMRQLMDAKKQQEDVKKYQTSTEDKVEFVLRTVLAPEAYQHLTQLKQNEPQVYHYIMNELVGQDVLQKIDLLIMLIRQRGGVARQIPLDVIVYLERKAKGIKSTIRVKRGDEVLDLGSYLKKD
ncbi:MAG: hypothetical protein BAJALOKI1v1_400022 [Promethearchaeota archaeon]|nr:MAG: hypothetical protein BAJALOKI1v1_400022 [Candidatus Lokiarchaeota archaeon]